MGLISTEDIPAVLALAVARRRRLSSWIWGARALVPGTCRPCQRGSRGASAHRRRRTSAEPSIAIARPDLDIAATFDAARKRPNWHLYRIRNYIRLVSQYAILGHRVNALIRRLW